MSGSPDIPIGERIRFYRLACDKKQAVVAGLAGVSEDYLSQIERGHKTPSTTLLHSIARVLNVPTSALLGEPVTTRGDEPRPIAAELNQALVVRGGREQSGPVDLAELRGRVEAAWSTWQTAPRRYSETAPLLPALVRDTESTMWALRAGTEAQARRESARIATDLYFLLRTFTKRIGRTDLSLLVADRGLRAAEDADDPLRVAAAHWNMGQVLLATNEADAAEEVSVRAACELRARESDDPVRLALHGALWLVATIASVRNGDAWKARDRLREQARPVAQVTGEGNAFWTVFGPTNVGLHAVSIEMENGETSEALRLADEVDTARCPSIERRATFSLEIARCYEFRREDTGVLLHLLTAEQQAPRGHGVQPACA